MHICVSKVNNIGSDKDLLPGRRQGIIRTNVGILLAGHRGTNFKEIRITISSGKWRPFCLGLNVLRSSILMGIPGFSLSLIHKFLWCIFTHLCTPKHAHVLHKNVLTHWGRVTHISVGKLTIIGSYNGLSPARRQAIIWTNGGILLIGPLGTNFSEILIRIQNIFIHENALQNVVCEMASILSLPQCIKVDIWNSCVGCVFTVIPALSWWCDTLRALSRILVTGFDINKVSRAPMSTFFSLRVTSFLNWPIDLILKYREISFARNFILIFFFLISHKKLLGNRSGGWVSCIVISHGNPLFRRTNWDIVI